MKAYCEHCKKETNFVTIKRGRRRPDPKNADDRSFDEVKITCRCKTCRIHEIEAVECPWLLSEFF